MFAFKVLFTRLGLKLFICRKYGKISKWERFVSGIYGEAEIGNNTVYFWLLRNVFSELLKENLRIGYGE